MSIASYEQISVLYYPFSMCTDGLALKRLLLIFDKVAFMYPHSMGFAFANYEPTYIQYALDLSRKPIFTDDIPERRIVDQEDLKHWMKVFTELEQKGVVFTVDPKPIVGQNNEVLTNACLADEYDEENEVLVAKALTSRFSDNRFLLSNQSKRSWIHPSCLVDNTFGWRIGMRGIPNSLKKYWFGRRRFLISSLSHDDTDSIPIEEISIAGQDDGFYFLRPKYAGSLSINRALITSIHLGIPLVTDNIFFQEAVSRKAQRILNFFSEGGDRSKEMPLITEYLGDLGKHQEFKSLESQRLISIVLQNILSSETLNKLSIKRVLLYKEKSALERARMLVAIHEWAHEVEDAMNNGKKDVTELSKDIYKSRILPEVNQYREALRKIDKRLIPQMIGTTVEGLGVSLSVATVSSLLAGLTLEQALILSIATAAPLIGKSIKEILDYKVVRKEKKADSSLAYLLNIK